MSLIVPPYQTSNREAFKDFINGAEVLPNDSLISLAIEDMLKSGLLPETLRQAKVTIFRDGKDVLKKKLGYASFNGHPLLSAYKLIEFPYFDEQGSEIFYRYKLIPPADKTKYLHPLGTPPLPYILPQVFAIKDKPNKPLHINEGEKKNLKALQHYRHSISLIGVCTFKAGKHSDESEDDKVFWWILEQFVWKGRTVYLSFDADLWTNPYVRMALYELAVKLHLRGALVRFLIWSSSEGKGIDDYLVYHERRGVKAETTLTQLEENAKPLVDFALYEHLNDVVRALAITGYQSIEAKHLIDVLAHKQHLKVSTLKESIREKHAEIVRKTVQQNVYFCSDGYLCRWNLTKEGKVPIKLANFQAQIIEEVIEDNGIEQVHKYVIEGSQNDEKLNQIEVPASAFQAMSWIHKWGSKAVIEPGILLKDYVRHATQITSQPQFTHCYTHTGWRKLEKEWVYLTTSGGVGATDVKVKLAEELQRYALPLTLLENEKKAIETSLSFLELGKKEITLPLFAILYLSPLTTIIEPQPNFSGFLYGESGSYKSSLALLLLSHFGSFPSVTCLSNFEDTANALMRRGFALKDTLMVVDDYHPTARPQDAQTKEAIAQRLLRSFANRTDRARLNPDGSEKGRHNPRAMLVITGEDLISVQSTLARSIVIEMKKGDIDVEKLTTLQANAPILPQAMLSYVLWLKEHLDDIKANFPSRFIALRKLAFDDEIHRRLPELSAFLQFSFETILTWLVDKKVITVQDQLNLMAESWLKFKELIRVHSERLKTEDPVEKFKDILSTLILQGKVGLEGKNNPSDIVGNRLGEFIGYHDETFLYLIPSAIWRSIQMYSRDSNSTFPVSKNTLYQMLRNKGVIETYNRENVVVMKIGVKTKRVLKLYRHYILDD